mmetsp:Transcript_28589/g.57537  ORF Transcript_28589/g.57537 Transcript_28589/m.57537 type:complete len:91 (+) Transcript_28589:235-507(+)
MRHLTFCSILTIALLPRIYSSYHYFSFPQFAFSSLQLQSLILHKKEGNQRSSPSDSSDCKRGGRSERRSISTSLEKPTALTSASRNRTIL